MTDKEKINIVKDEEIERIMLVNDEDPVVNVQYSMSGESQSQEHITVINVGTTHRWRWVIASAIAAAAVTIGILLYVKHRNFYELDVPISVTPEENIEKLQAPVNKCKPEVVMTTDSVLEVPLNFYELKGLKASIEAKEPAVDDKDVYLYTRFIDYADGKYLGSYVNKGKLLSDDPNRAGYFAAVDSQMVIGISRYENVRDFCVEKQGYYFRQYVLVSGGVLPRDFDLHGKVERRALGRKEGNANLYYIASIEPETMWDFADALREYGFVDAIYITGGAASTYYYRTRGGKQHILGDSIRDNTVKWPHKPSGGPWLVFRKQ